MKIINLFCGLGGNRVGWPEDAEVTAVDNNPEILEAYAERFPADKVIEADARQYIQKEYSNYDFAWVSPPCQSHSKMVKATRHKIRKFPDMELYGWIIFMQHHFEGLYVIENVNPYYEPIISPTIRMGRHLIWANFDLFGLYVAPESPKWSAPVSEWQRFYGLSLSKNIYYDGNHDPAQVLRNCVHWSLSQHVYEKALASVALDCLS